MAMNRKYAKQSNRARGEPTPVWKGTLQAELRSVNMTWYEVNKMEWSRELGIFGGKKDKGIRMSLPFSLLEVSLVPRQSYASVQ